MTFGRIIRTQGFHEGQEMRYADRVVRCRQAKRRSKVTTAIVVAGVTLLSLVGIQGAGQQLAGAGTRPGTNTGFTSPFSGTPQYERLAPTEITNPGQLNQPIGQRAADRIAVQLGLTRSDSFTTQQYLEFISGKGAGGKPDKAELVDASALILTNTVGRPLYSNVDGHLTPSVLASYGLFVTTSGLLESPAQADAPTRLVNKVIMPTGYMGTWCRANGATASLVALYKSAYTLETLYGFAAQRQSAPAQLIANKKEGVTAEVGMSMGPALWLVNFLLLYMLNPTLAAEMPANWAPIPPTVANAILASPTGQVPYSEYASFFH